MAQLIRTQMTIAAPAQSAASRGNMILTRPPTLLFRAETLERSCSLTEDDLSNDCLRELTCIGLCSVLAKQA